MRGLAHPANNGAGALARGVLPTGRAWRGARRSAGTRRDHPEELEIPVKTTIYDRVGGRAAVAAVVDALYDRILGDELLAPYFARTEMHRQKAHMRSFVAAALGGPAVYAGRDMAAAHAGLNVTDAAFDAVVGHLVAALQSLDVPDAEIGAIGAVLAPLRDQVIGRSVLRAAA
jgi:hemoglobin